MKIYMKQKVFSLVDKYKLYDENQNLLFYTEGTLFSLSGMMKMYDKNKKLIFTFKHKIVTILPRVYVIDHRTNEEVIIKKNFTFFYPRLQIKTRSNSYVIDGSLLQYKFNVLKDNVKVASVKKQILSWGDTYELDIKGDYSDLILAILIGIDTIIHNDRYK
ncbi:LURP-one-related/scramblase family protein [Haploplasma modicum]|uniref:LURP-one-related/scramblase family protein n=1 Tax=Haploplasma modicum TaxID=2150 RepID=UPI00214A8D99|nr:LURP-one-related family protein [Haploplasma modicum]MCR1809473.1 LURP-one-related family protein [Haploplasma modicum]